MEGGFLVAEIGSTTTVLSLFNERGELKAQIQKATTVENIMDGYENAFFELFKMKKIEGLPLYATSSAAGGLKMTVHGLVYDMTVKAASEAALGAGAVIYQVTAGELKDCELEKLKEINPNIILLAGGVDYGEEKTVINNALKLKKTNIKAPIIYAGNIACQEKVKEIFKESENDFLVVENVYPSLDELNIEPTRRAIQKVFQAHIVKASGIKKLKGASANEILPTPGAIFEGGKILYETIGDLLIIDVGGATTDVHSFTEGSKFYMDLQIAAEPFAKRTVEGDLGVFKNALNLWSKIKKNNCGPDTNLLEEDFKNKLDLEGFAKIIENWSYIPEGEEERQLIMYLASEAIVRAMKRHCGRLKFRFDVSGRKQMVEGKDLTGIKWVIGTGGVLGLHEKGEELLLNIVKKFPVFFEKENYLMPSSKVGVLLDKNYILAAAGIMAKTNPYLAKDMLLAHFNRQLTFNEV